MDRFDSMNLLVRVVERQSFSVAASDLGIPRSSATLAIKQFEERLGVRLLHRTTRHVTPTLEGEIYYKRCKAILAEIEDAEAALTGREVRGLLRIEVHGPMARTFILPELPTFLNRHPALTLHILSCRITVTNSDTYANLARLGFGLMQAPRYRYAEDLAAGSLVEVLHEHPPSPTPISVLYPKSRQLSPRVRVFIDWLVEVVAPKL